MSSEQINSIQLNLIRSAYERGMRTSNIKPEDQLAPWMILGLKALEEEQQLSASDVQRYQEMGGTDHPDPTLRSMG